MLTSKRCCSSGQYTSATSDIVLLWARKSHLFLEKKNIENSLEKSCFYSLFFMLGIEVLDGFSEKWGFSNYDLLSNFVGTGIFYFQQKKLSLKQKTI